MAQEYKLKGVSSLNLKNGDKQEVEVEGVEGGKLLLLKVQDKVHATSANCTHYGAPLKSGVLTPEGRLTCPWHGGELLCYKPGDISDKKQHVSASLLVTLKTHLPSIRSLNTTYSRRMELSM
jgi:nitrite reductase/ring-hydroxylating ferredoxin subunit